jgi:IMP dehydrogenase
MENILSDSEKKLVNEYMEAKGLPTDYGVTFGDVTLAEHYSDIRSRAEIFDFKTRLSAHLEMNIPLASANMECVTGSELAIALQREGGLGFIPQSLTLDERLETIEKIRRADSTFIEKPLTIRPNQTLEEAKILMNTYSIFSLIVTNSKNEPLGVLSTRDWKYETNNAKRVKDLMSQGKLIKAPLGVSFKKAEEVFRKYRIEKLPLVDKKGRLAGLITAHGLFYNQHHPNALRDDRGNFITTGTIGVGRKFTKNHLYEVEKQVEKGITVLLIDTARAFSVNTQEALREVKKHFPKLDIVVGNVSTPDGAKFLFENGADSVKVNQGRGQACRTSEIGIGIPQITALARTAAIAKKYKKTIIADGGMKNSGDVIKSIAAGADIAFSGFLFIGLRESAAPLYYNKQGLPVKIYEGSASFQAQIKRMGKGNLDHIRRPEGVAEEVVVTGTVQETVQEIIDAFKSAMSYQGFHNIKELREKATFELQSKAGLFEGVKK